MKSVQQQMYEIEIQYAEEKAKLKKESFNLEEGGHPDDYTHSIASGEGECRYTDEYVEWLEQQVVELRAKVREANGFDGSIFH